MIPKFSVALIARNESKTLPRLLSSLTEFQNRGGEIILVDTGSTDNTAELARQWGCKVFEEGERFLKTIDEKDALAMNALFVAGGEEPIVQGGEKLFDFSKARNYAASLCENDMVAMPDCDEIYTHFDIDAINKTIEEGNDQLEYNFVFAHDADGNELVKFLHCKFYNRKKLEWVNIIHEVLAPVSGAPEAQKIFLSEAIIKLEHWQNHETNRGKYLPGLAYDTFVNQDNDRNAHYFARELMYTGRFESAIRQFKRHIDMNKWPTERSQSFVHMGECQDVLGRSDEAVQSFIKAFEIEPNRREPLMRLAEHYYRRDMPMQTIAFALAATQIKGNNYYANFAPFYENLPHELLYWAYYKIGNYTQSNFHFGQAQSYKPFEEKYLHDMRFYYDLPKITIAIPTLGRPEGLKRCLDSIKTLVYPEDKIEVIVEEDEPRLGVPKRFKSIVEKSTGDWIVYASNDIEFTPFSIMIALKTAWDNNKAFMAFNTGEVSQDEGNICEHFMIHRKVVEKLKNEVFDTDFNHVGVDNLLWAKMKKIGQNMRCARAIINHYHFSKKNEQKSDFDETYAVGWKQEMVEKDRALLKVKLEELAKKPFNEI
jgi:glycosyltransferase involved in cell wall biosynthesis